MVILGIGDGPDAGAALVVDDRLEAVALQERHDQVPRSRAFPWLAVEEVLEQSGIRSRDVDLIAVAGRFSPPFFLRRHPGLRKVARNAFSAALDAQVFFQAMLRQSGLGALEADRAAEWLEQRFRSRGFVPQRVILVDTHTALAHAAYRTQDDDEVLILSLHPMGDGVGCAVHRGAAGQVDLMWSQKGFASLHVHLQRCAAAIGLQPLLDDQRMWGLAARGEPDSRLVEELERQLRAEGPRLSRRSYPLPATRRVPVYRMLASVAPEVAAASVLYNLERTVCALVRHHVEAQGIRTLAVAGAIFDNPRLCAAVAALPEVERLWVGPTPGWGALPIGAAAFEAGLAPRSDQLGRLGRSYDPRQCERALRVAGLEGRPFSVQAVVGVLASGQGWVRFAGRAGEGRHGGGHRSVLVRADDRAALERVRTALRLSEHDEPACLWISGSPGSPELDSLGHRGRHASAAVRVDVSFAERYPAAITADGRALLHRLTPEDEDLYEVVVALEAETGCGALACFPLGREQAPVVALPGDALRLWRHGQGRGVLQLGPFLVYP